MGRRAYKPKSFESSGRYKTKSGRSKADTTANIYESMLRSDAWKDLSSKQQVLYLYCKAQYYGKTKPGADFPDIPELQGEDFFYLNRDLVISEYELYTEGNRAKFYKDMDCLTKHGFIQKVTSGKSSHQRNIYRFVDGWIDWKPE